MQTPKRPGHLVLLGVIVLILAGGAYAVRKGLFGRLTPLREFPPDPGMRLVLEILGDQPDDEFSSSLAGCGDVDGDGVADVIVGGVYDDGVALDAGRAGVYSGKDGSLLLELPGPAPDARLGYGVAGVGDLNGDGVPDLIVGATGGVGRGGQAHVYSGKDGSELYTLSEEVQPDDDYGFAVAGVGDVDADGTPDVAVGAPGTWKENRKGYVTVNSGRDGKRIAVLFGDTDGVGDRFGFAVSAAGDLDGDGHADVLVGSLGENDHAGRVYVFSGKDASVLRRFDGDGPHDELGHSVALCGDLDGDGKQDFLLGAFHHEVHGYVRVCSAADGSVLLELRAPEAGDAFGHSVAGGGDVDGDGVPDLIVGAPNARREGAARVGAVYVYSGKDGSLIARCRGDLEQGHFGYVVASPGDLDGDGRADVLAGTVIVTGRPGRALVLGLARTD